MKYLKLIACSMLAISYSNIVLAANCDAVNAKVLEAMAKVFDVHSDDIELDKTFYDQNFEADVSVQLEIPLSFGWEALPPVGMTIRAKAAYMPKF